MNSAMSMVDRIKNREEFNNGSNTIFSKETYQFNSDEKVWEVEAHLKESINENKINYIRNRIDAIKDIKLEYSNIEKEYKLTIEISSEKDDFEIPINILKEINEILLEGNG